MISARIRFHRIAGRDAESALLVRGIEGALSGKGALAVIDGEAGIGKTRLLQRLQENAGVLGCRFVRVACYPYFRTPLTPVREAVQALTGADLPLRRAKYEAFTAILKALVDSSADQPVVLAIDDLQWGDRASLEVLDFVVRHFHDARIFLVCAYRREHDAGHAGAIGAIARIAQAANISIHLGPLTLAEVSSLVEPSFADRPELRGIDLGHIVERACGNPLFIEEMLTDLIDGNLDASRAVPSSLRANVFERLSRAPSPVRELIEAASIFGSDVHVDDLLSICPFAAADHHKALDGALATALLQKRSPTSLAFRHALIRDIVYDGLSLTSSRELHGAVARRFEERADAAASIAHHWACAGDAERAAFWGERAGDEALRVFAFVDAAQFFRRAAELSPAAAERPRLRERASSALIMNGSNREALRELSLAMELYRELDSRADFLRVATVLIATTTTDIGYLASMRAMRVSIAEAKRLANPNESCIAFTSAADHLRMAGHGRRTDVLIERAAQLLPHAHIDTLARFHDVAGKIAVGKLENSLAREHFERARHYADQSKNVSLFVRVASNQAEFYQRILEYDYALEIWRNLYRLVNEQGFGWRIAFAALGLADILLLTGEVAEAESLVDLALERGLECETLRMQAANVGTRIGILLGRNDLIDRCALDSTLEAAFRIRDSAYTSPVASAFVELALWRGDPVRAKAIVERYCSISVGAMLSERMLPYIALADCPVAMKRAERTLAEMPPYLALLRARGALQAKQMDEAVRFARIAERDFSLLSLRELAGRARLIAGRRVRENPADESGLTPREREICMEVAKGQSNREIAERLGISIKTVGHHLESIYARLGVEGRAKLIAYLNAAKYSAA